MSSQRIPKVEVPRDLNMAQELRRETTRNSAEISLNFWQEFESIRATQRNRLAGESLRRERINSLMREGKQEANKEAEALSRSISAQGMITLPTASAADPPPSPLMNAIAEGTKNVPSPSKPGIRKFQNSKTKLNTNTTANENDNEEQSAIAKLAVATASSIKNTPSTSKMRSTKKTKK